MRLPLLLLFVGAFAAGAAAQTPAASTPPAAAPPAAPAVEAAPAPPADYTYDASGRRDPFVSLVKRGADTHPVAKGARPEGIAGVLVDGGAVRGIMQSRGVWVAMIAAPNGRSYTIRPGDHLMDGSVRAINAQAVMLMQDVSDPLSLEKQREVRKQLRGEVK